MIGAVVYRQLRQHLGLEPGLPLVIDVQQQIALIEEDVLQLLGGDALPLTYESTAWRTGSLTDGSPAEVPSNFIPQVQPDGSQVVFDKAGNIALMMPENGHYFDPIYAPLAEATSVDDIEEHLGAIETYDKPVYLDKSQVDLAQKSQGSARND
jgi:uroporphyrinogen decarboxylase